jgi:RHH-type proline utilization regulon transcriptional repressor/proline dehydrogenase/delta 1-pyrroline-5-carboxylate dehydrogenase
LADIAHAYPLTEQIGNDLLVIARQQRHGILSSRFWSDRLMRWAMTDPAFKVQLFRFVDALPMLSSPASIHRHLIEYLSQPGVTLPPGLDLGLKIGGMAKGLLAATVVNRIKALAGNFIAGTDAASALRSLRILWDDGIGFSVDLLGEACVSQGEAAEYQRRYCELIATLPGEVEHWPPVSRLEFDHLGPIPRTNVSIKITALDPRVDAIDAEGTMTRLLRALRPILTAAARQKVCVTFDMEQYALKDLTIELFERCCEAIEFPAGLAIQAYLRSGEDDARRIIDWTRRAQRQVTVRLIKGAYWDYEVIHAEQMGWPIPVWTAKAETDACFERMAELLVAAIPREPAEPGVKLAVGTHNIRSIARTMAMVQDRGLPESALEVQMLYGMADQLKAAILDHGLRLRQYVPVGQMIPGMAYLVRRLLENTSNQSWLRAGFFEDLSNEQLLAPPSVPEADSPVERPEHGQPPLATLIARAAERHRLSPAVEGLGDGRPFFNEPFRDFADRHQREQFARAVAAAELPHVANDSTAEQAAQAVARAASALPAWRAREPLARASILVAAAAAMRNVRDELAGLMIREAGKTWREADADVCEAIDYLEFYARAAVGLFEPRRLGRFVGELDETWHEPRGVAVVISPWNFPLAICTGMTAAALVTGNTAIVKPAEQTPAIARRMAEILWQSGVPADVLQFLPGPGVPVGAALVRDRRVAIVAFTGSREVGLEILAAAAQTPDDQGFVKTVVCEMGGKNAIIVDQSADMDEAVLGVRQSAFSYAGQKCSACSRAILVGDAGQVFLPRLVEATRALVIGEPGDPATDVGPVIDEESAAKIGRAIEAGLGEGRLELACDVPEGLARRVGKPYVGPHIFSGIRPEHSLAREEIFGPVLAVMHAQDFDEALALANASSFKLTGGVFSRTPSHLEQARREFRVGNLYLNRGITGALVARQPFGGFGLSGTGLQAGGAEYLREFVQSRCVCENTLRHGFAPGLD